MSRNNNMNVIRATVHGIQMPATMATGLFDLAFDLGKLLVDAQGLIHGFSVFEKFLDASARLQRAEIGEEIAQTKRTVNELRVERREQDVGGPKHWRSLALPRFAWPAHRTTNDQGAFAGGGPLRAQRKPVWFRPVSGEVFMRIAGR